MQEQYIPSAKILGAEKLLDQKVLKYTYFDTQTGLKGSFYSHQKVNYIPNLLGYLWLIIEKDQQDKDFFWFDHRFHNNLVERNQPSNLWTTKINYRRGYKRIVRKRYDQIF